MDPFGHTRGPPSMTWHEDGQRNHDGGKPCKEPEDVIERERARLPEQFPVDPRQGEGAVPQRNELKVNRTMEKIS